MNVSKDMTLLYDEKKEKRRHGFLNKPSCNNCFYYQYMNVRPEKIQENSDGSKTVVPEAYLSLCRYGTHQEIDRMNRLGVSQGRLQKIWERDNYDLVLESLKPCARFRPNK